MRWPRSFSFPGMDPWMSLGGVPIAVGGQEGLLGGVLRCSATTRERAGERDDGWELTRVELLERLRGVHGRLSPVGHAVDLFHVRPGHRRSTCGVHLFGSQADLRVFAIRGPGFPAT